MQCQATEMVGKRLQLAKVVIDDEQDNEQGPVIDARCGLQKGLFYISPSFEKMRVFYDEPLLVQRRKAKPQAFNVQQSRYHDQQKIDCRASIKKTGFVFLFHWAKN